MLIIYTFLVLLVSLAVIPLTLLLDMGSSELRGGWKQRAGFVPRLPVSSAPRIWIHAVSVGEVQLARQLLGELRSLRPDLEALLTSTTQAGRKLAHGAGLPATWVSAFPVDLPFCMSRALSRGRPNLLVLMETEIWPNLIRRCAWQGIGVVMANGRISPRSLPRYRLLGPALARLLGDVDRFLMQSEDDARRIESLRAPRDRIEVTGNLKWDLPAPGSPAVVRQEMGLEPEAPVIVAGSTFEGEEEVVLGCWESLRAEFPGLALVLAPRHPRRFEAVAALLERRRVSFRRRSRPAGGAAPVLLLDTVGELRRAYATGTICFVGGSLVSRGGQNLMEPAAAGRPVIFGPRTENFALAAEALIRSGGGFRIGS
ncbi:MAG TPA: glycosyltransferase N-terminal domain-containing protein, partial [Candidatus Polarisedimenticolia bacterium]|nr:glycosyltransferase N-terminal domain-containing protein [Candidatus Polarisedimenticolia bacterium]